MKAPIHISLALVSLLIATSAFSQNPSIKGQIRDREEHPIVSATVSLIHSSDSTLLKVALTDANGNFDFENIPAGVFLVSSSMKGYSSIYRGPFDTEDGEMNSPLSFVMNASAFSTENTNPILIQADGKTTVNLEGNKVDESGTAWDVIQIAPQLANDGNGKLLLNGNSNFQIEIDGKKTELTGWELKNKLQSIKAVDVSAIEIIESPAQAIVNVITISGTQSGLYMEASHSVTYGRAIGNEQNLLFMYNTPKLNVYGKYNYADNSAIDKATIYRTFPYDGMNMNFNLESTTKSAPQTHTAQFGLDYTGKKGFSIGAKIDGDKMHNTENVIDNYILSFEGIDTTFGFQQNYTTHNTEDFLSGNLHASQEIGRNGAKISSTFSISKIQTNWNETLPYEMADGLTYRYANNNNLNQTSGELSYLQPLFKNIIVLAGYKNIITENISTFSVELKDNAIWNNVPETVHVFDYNQSNQNAYLFANASIHKLNIYGGVQLIKVSAKGFAPSLNQTTHKSDVRISPSITVKQKLGSSNSIKYNFTQEIDRPSANELNPYGHYISQNKYETGNLLLKPEITNSNKLTWTLFELISVSGEMAYMKNGMQSVTRYDSLGTSFQMTENLSSSKKSALEIKGLIPVGEKLIIQSSVCWSKTHFESTLYGTEINHIGKAFSASTQVLVSLPQDFSIYATGWYASANGNGIIHTEAMGSVNAGISKEMFDNRLEVSIDVNDIFKTAKMSATILTASGEVGYVTNPDSQSINISAKYNFGNEKVGKIMKDKVEGE